MRAMTSLMIDFFNMLISTEPEICRLRFFILLLHPERPSNGMEGVASAEKGSTKLIYL